MGHLGLIGFKSTPNVQLIIRCASRKRISWGKYVILKLEWAPLYFVFFFLRVSDAELENIRRCLGHCHAPFVIIKLIPMRKYLLFMLTILQLALCSIGFSCFTISRFIILTILYSLNYFKFFEFDSNTLIVWFRLFVFYSIVWKIYTFFVL